MSIGGLSIGGLRVVHVIRIVNWSYQDNFKPGYFFFTKKILRVQKEPKRKTSNFHPLRSLDQQKNVALVVFCYLIFVFVCSFLVVNIFVCVKSFPKKINRLNIVLIASINYTTIDAILWYQCSPRIDFLYILVLVDFQRMMDNKL